MQLFKRLLLNRTTTSKVPENTETDDLICLQDQQVIPLSKTSSPARVDGGIVESGLPDLVYQWRFKAKNQGMSFANVSVISNDNKPNKRSKKGHYFYGGPIFKHFGHFLAESIHRFKDYDYLAAKLPIEKVVFVVRGVHKRNVLENALPPHFYSVLRYLGIPRDKILIIKSPTTFSHLWVARQQSFFRNLDCVSSDYLSFLQKREVLEIPDTLKKPVEKLYVSRSNYLLRGSFAGEKYIEETLRSNGFHIYYPEKHDLIQQLMVYKSAKEIVFSEGTALHVLELLGKLNAQIGVIRRRQNGLEAFKGVLRSRAVNPVIYTHTDDLPSLLVVKGHKRPATGSAISYLDAEKLQLFLATQFGVAGFNCETYKASARKDIELYQKHYEPELIKHQAPQSVLQNYIARKEVIFVKHSLK